MSFDTTLNLVWVATGLLALALLGWREYRQRHQHSSGLRWLHVVAVALIVFALFPYVSASDDILQLDNLGWQLRHPGQHDSSPQKRNLDLLRLYESLEHSLEARTTSLSLVLVFVSLVLSLVKQQQDRSVPHRAGRSPPLCA